MTYRTTLAAVLASALLAGCTGQQNSVATGTAAGGVLGAVAGQAVGGDTRSTAVGALAGMSAGMLTGAVVEGQRPQQQTARTCRRADGSLVYC